jgi:hypothetical protein
MRQKTDELFLPELVSPNKGSWEKTEVDIADSAVDTKHRKAWVPKAYTPAQKLARLHELGHVKYSPDDWDKRIVAVMAMATKKVDPNAVLKILKMLEENRIDWLLWDKHETDLRPAREVFDWAKMPEPASKLAALGWCLQLAWTVWASRGLGGKAAVPNQPPARALDPDTGEFFDRCWALLMEEDEPLGRAMIRGCMRMYQHPTDEMRDKVAAELADFFPLEEEKEEQPPKKKEEQQKQEEEQKKEQEYEEEQDKKETGIGSEIVTKGSVQIHDHTATVRSRSFRITSRVAPVAAGIGMRFANRYFSDKAIFGQRRLTDAGIMVDGSGSMSWTDEDMQHLVKKLPSVKAGVYSGVNAGYGPDGERIYGRICIIARDGKVARYDGLDPECNGDNAVDFEALKLLATWPRPRLWLSDGLVCGGKYAGPSTRYDPVGYYQSDGTIHEKCNAWMKAHDILRVPHREVMHKLLNREPVTLYRSCTPDWRSLPEGDWLAHTLKTKWTDCFPADVKPMPVRFQL